MLPQKVKTGTVIGLLLLCSSGLFVTATTTVFQNGPLTCYTCDSVEDCAQGKGLLRKCEGATLAQSCLVVFDATGAVEQRGCSDKNMYESYCNGNPGKCPTCSSIGCNDGTSLDQYVECLSCDSSSDPNCVINPSKVAAKDLCLGECMTALYPIADWSDIKSKYHLVRACLRDKDIDEREKCLSGDDPLCAACAGADCNVAKLPEDRQSCYHCDEAEDCEDPEQHECVPYNDRDECFIRFDEDYNDVIAMGCRSDFPKEIEAIELVKKKALWFCEGENCNGYEYYAENFPINSCSLCNSLTDQSCVIAPDTVSRERCMLIPYTQCFERAIPENGGTLRGCLNDLMPDQFYDCLTGTDPNCRICHGNDCNVQNIPADRPQCLRCDSSIDSNCHTKPTTLTPCLKFDANDSCVSNYVNGVTKRGCLSDFACDADSRSCEICKGDGCNKENVQKLTEEIYGVFQTLPLNCYSCTGEACQNGITRLGKCEGSLYQDCWTVFDAEGSVVRRGCEGLIETNYQTHCEEHPELCFNCKSNGCNTIEDHTAYQECLYCNSDVDPNCVFNPTAISKRRRCTEGCIASLYPRKGNEQVHDLVRTCLEDIEPDERQNCGTGNCKKCDGAANCNTDILPEDTPRLVCNSCSGDDCDEPVAKECVGFTENDQCYIRFDNVTYSAIAMGCRSEFTTAQITAEAKQFFICDGAECNDYKNLSPARLCAVCDSATDVNCAVDATKVDAISRCQVNPYTDCYTRVRSDGHTERGCLHNLPTEIFLQCRDPEDPNCNFCSESNCNKVVFPADRPQCYRCNSTYSTDCEATPSTAQACPTYNATDSCTTKIVNGITHRGCSSELNCADAGRKTCKTCANNNCNTVDLISEQIGDPGKFQTLPLNCYQVEGSGSGVFRKCEGDNKQTCTVAFASNGSVISRGCSDLLENVCSIEGNNCYDCKSNGCNVATSESDYVDCLFCDAQESDACVFKVADVTRSRKCHKGCMTALYPRTDDMNPAFELTRTCVDDLDLDEREECEAGNNDHCKACNGAKCNNDELGERRSCYHCSGDDCQSPSVKQCRAIVEHEQCYVQFDEAGEVVELGCKSQYDPPEVDILLRAKRLWFCDDDNCNIFDNLPTAHACSICNSRTDPLCATSPNSVTSNTICSQLPFPQCYMRVLEGGHTDRGCLSSLEGDQFINCLNGVNATDCLICDEARCNNKLHPSDRLSCNTCSSDNSASCESTPQSSQICLKYNVGQQCVSELTQDGITKRGCSLDVTCDPSSTACVSCDGENCNTSNLKRKLDGKPGQWQSLPLTCHSCSTEQDCATVSGRTQVCQGVEYCMTVFNADGAVIRRGCSEDVESDEGDYCDLNSGKCHNCNSNQCNSATQLDDYIDCIYCDSKNNANCALNVNSVQNRRKCQKACMTALYPRDENSTVWEVTRTCLDDKEVLDQNNCMGGLCKSCDSNACNLDILPEDRRSCWSCNGEDCEDPKTAECAAYKENDRCFLLFNGESDVSRLGCESDLTESEWKENEIRLLFCDDGDNCNFFDKIPSPRSCARCNSIDDPTCAASPAGIATVAQCSVLPNTQCYTKVNDDGSTTRGCVSSLPQTQLLDCLSGNAADCKACLGDRCNIDIFPSDRRICHRCNSLEDPLCESASVNKEACPMYVADDFCTAKYVNGQTHRGCGSEFQCDGIDKRFCRQCTNADNCNSADLASLDIGNPGKWQVLPINCYACVGFGCQGQSPGALRKCEGNDWQTCGVVFANNGSVIERGCTDQIFSGDFVQQCDDGNCKFCKSSGCNTAQSLDNFVDCLHCDSTENSDCVLNVNGVSKTRSCHGKCMVGLYERSIAETNSILDLSRSCLDDLDVDDQLDCESGQKDYCKTCQGASCNTDLIPEVRLECYVCEDEASCASQWVQSQTCLGFRENDQCYKLYNENRVERMGCASDLETLYMQTNNRKLLFCDGDRCNNLNNQPIAKSCAICNSTSDINCAGKAEQVPHAVCDDFPYTDCFTSIGIAGTTIRGCVNDLPDDAFYDCLSGDSNSCQTCDSNNCNEEIYPAGRRSCNRCNSLDDPNCASSAQQYATVCPIYEENDKCVTAIDRGQTLRGCSSEFTCNTSDRDICRYCETDNCNLIDLLNSYIGAPGKWQALPLSCYHCEGEDCASGYGQLKECEENNVQTCTTVFADDGSVTSRGCSDVVSANHDNYCDENSSKCLGCKSNACNNVDSLDLYDDCYFCDSTEGKTCSINFDTATRTRKCHGGCMVALYPRSSSADPSYETSRSCLDDLEYDDRTSCANGALENCKSCEGARCNTADLPEDRLECYSCIDDDCEDAEVRKCNAYHPTDKCYTLFDYEGSISGLGCRSEFEIEVATDLVKQKLIRLCDGKNCNRFGSVPEPQECSSCNSASDSRCATNPNLVANTTRCATLPYTECYTHVNSDGHTLRGCLSELDSETFYSCLTNPDDKRCEVCTGDKCNEIDVFPTNRLTCHQCVSSSDPTCSSSPNRNTVCPIYDEADTCITNFRNGITTRGCSSSVQCDNANDKNSCRTCPTSGCNTIDLSKISSDGQPGRWQELPISCYTCENEEDCATVGGLSVCENNDYQNCMTVFNAENKVTQRGCSDALLSTQEAYCDSNPEKCPRCNSNGCNVAYNMDQYIECLACDTDASGNCVRNVDAITQTRRCYQHCMTALFVREKEDNPAYGLSRSCLDDMEFSDREDCQAGSKEYCSVCNTDKCNTIAIPEERLSCYHCQDDDCQDPQAQTCANYRDNDKCYVQYDERSSIIALGCRSEFSNEDADYLLKEKRLYTCDQNNCNTFDALPTPTGCVLCNSRTDIACAVAPQVSSGYTTCSQAPFTQCYSRVLTDGMTERGCLSSLYDDEFLSCLNGTSSTCEMCEGTRCNNKVFPSERTSCHICDSSVNPTCESQPDSLSICPKYDAEETCVTQLLNDVTHRGCSSSLSCDATDTKSCRKCTGNGCNTVNLAKRKDDNFGKWQDLPLRCWNCAGAACQSAETTVVATCLNNNEQDCVVVFDASGSVLHRGCSDEVEAAYEEWCDASDDNCYNCKSNECNSANSRTEFVDCVYCDSYKNSSCVWDPHGTQSTRKCAGGCMTALYPSDGNANPAYDLIRTCLSDKEAADQTTCASGSDANCKSCTGASCNVQDLPEDRVTCYSCRGEDCDEPMSRQCPLYKKDDKCFIWVDAQNSVSEMGCISSFRNQELDAILKTKRVYVCDGNDCNTFDKLPSPQKCAVCDSNDDVACAIDALEIGTFNNCNQQPYTSCYSKLASDGSTARGCLYDLPADDFLACLWGNDTNCETCHGDGCNREIFPADRLQCYSCNTQDDPSCESDPSRIRACPRVVESETCISALGNNETVRGCRSQVFCDAADRRNCRPCIGTSCNNIDLRNIIDDGYHGIWQTLPLRCHTCEGEHCKVSLGPTVTCDEDYEEDCMTVFDENGDIRRRGCSDAVETYENQYCRQNPEKCYRCKSNECNVAWSLSDYVTCAFCNSSSNALCVTNPEYTEFPTRHCYKECMVAMKEEELVRSCLDDKELFVQHVCRTDASGKECATCDSDNCNKFNYPSDRLKCHVCTNSACTSSRAEYCEKYDENDYCFAKYENERVELLGCASSQNASDLADWEANNQLYSCKTNECNDLTKLPTPNECLSCDSSKTLQCAQDPTQVTTTESCPRDRSSCVTRIVGADTLRSCANALTEAEEASCLTAGTCATCNGSKCNAAIFPANRRKCYICNSVSEGSCMEEGLNPLICPHYAANDNCVSIKDTDGYVKRGCSSDISCSGTENCEVCSTDLCNTVDLSAAGFVTGSLALSWILAAGAIFTLNN